MTDRAWEENVVRMMLEAEDERLADALNRRDAASVGRVMGLSAELSQTAVDELGSLDDDVFSAALERALKRSEFLKDPAPANQAQPRPSRRKRRGVRLRGWPLLAGPAIAAALVAILVLPVRPTTELPDYRLYPLALGEATTKAPPKRIEGTITWRPGTTFHVRLEPRMPPPVEVSAQLFLRAQGQAEELPMTVEARDDGLHVFGRVGQTTPLPSGKHELVLAVVPRDDRTSSEEVESWSKGTTRDSGRQLFWYEVHVKGPPED